MYFYQVVERDITYYLYKFERLRRDRKNGGAPHKPILLLSIIDLFEQGLFQNQEIEIIPELVARFRTNWSGLVQSNHHPIFAMPFYHMNSEPFWILMPNAGCEKWINSKSSMRSLRNLKIAVNYARLDNELALLLLKKESRNILRQALLNKYFPNSKNYPSSDLNNTSDSMVVYEDSEVYKRKLLEIKSNLDNESFEEEVFVRSGIFKREILKVYDNTCAISGHSVDTVLQATMVDACHIVPFSKGYDDTIVNGISLTPSIHRAFDRGLISISDDYKVLMSNKFIENNSPYRLSQFEGKTIHLPTDKTNYPSAQNLKNHRTRFNF
jgi:putative restriction endonuclease